MSDQLLTVQETADILRVSRSTVWRWCKDGTIPSAFKLGRTWRISSAEVDKIINGNGTHQKEIEKAMAENR
ncbi:MAG: helix-turn-helix domain-containing protein [Anaerolineae bacterium]|nr:helix-turn-helix domain-containing protein [Anaerolineae bacterium]